MVNLHAHPLGSLLVSAFLPSSYPFLWLPLVALGIFVVDRVFGWRRSLLLVLFAHIGGTLFSELVLDWRVHHGMLPAAALSQEDVGPSYIVVCGLTASACYGWLGRDPALLRVARALAAGCALALLVPSLFGGLSHWDVAAVGHVFSIASGVIGGGVFIAFDRRRGRPDHRSGSRKRSRRASRSWKAEEAASRRTQPDRAGRTTEISQ